MVTDADFLKQEIEWGISADNPDFIALAKATIDQVADLPLQTVMDYGAGVGVYAEQARLRGWDTYVFDIWPSHCKYMRERFPLLKQLDEPVTTDLMLFIEVAEHMTDFEVSTLFAYIQPKYILFSACPTTTDNDAYWGHINIKSPEQWFVFMNKYGYVVERKLDYPTGHTYLLRYGKK